jgi:glycosyltransferase involved in cell wall biosynthesis
VGVPCFNRPLPLEDVLACLVKQTYRNLEIIVSDDCSPDPNVQEVAETFASKDARIRFIRQEKNLGLIANHNFVLSLARGEFFVWVNDDDLLPADYIEKCVLHAYDASGIQLVGTPCDRYLDEKFWYRYETRSNVGKSCHIRLREMIPQAFVAPYGFEQYLYGLNRTATLKRHPLAKTYDYIFALFFAMSEEGYLHVAPEVTLHKNTTEKEVKAHEAAGYIVERHRLLGLLPRRFEEAITLAQGMMRTIARSSRLGLAAKAHLLALCGLDCSWLGIMRPSLRRVIRSATGIELRDPREGKTRT